MRFWKISVQATLYLVASIMLGIAISLWVSQRIWLEANHVRIESYARSILLHAETVAQSLTQALVLLQDANSDTCSVEDQNSLKKAVFDQPFVRDAGRINDGKIICSALWGRLPAPFTLEGHGLTTRNNVTLWNNTSSYISPGATMDISSKGNVFAVTSTAAFSAYESTSDDLSASITSPDDAVIMRTFGDQGIIKKEINPVRLCSTRFYFCINAAVKNSIFSAARSGLLTIAVLAGACLGILIWYSIEQLLKNRRTLTSRLKRAIRNESLDVHYQPIVRAENYKVSGFEALARWSDKINGTVPPNIFIKIAEESGLSLALSKVIISKSLKECKDILLAKPGVYLSLNLNTTDLLSEEILNHLNQLCEQYCIPRSQIAIEVLETSTTEIEVLRKRIDEYRCSGYLIFIDDFGTGYSSLSYLSNLKIDKIKIDRTFTQSIEADSSAGFILNQIKLIATSIGATVIYEGIETEAQRQIILKLNQNALAQGWLFSKAVPIGKLQEKLE